MVLIKLVSFLLLLSGLTVCSAQQPASPSPSNPFTRGFPAPAAALIAAAPPQTEGAAAGAPAASLATPAPLAEGVTNTVSNAAAPGPSVEAGTRQLDPCACTQTGISGGANTSAIGCGQHLLTFGSSDFVCFVNDPVACNPGVKLTSDSRFPGAAYKACSPGTEGAALPMLRTLLRSNNRIYLFYTYLRESNLTSVQAQNITVFAPENQGFTAAIADGSLEQGDLSSPDFVRQLVLDSIVPEALTVDQLRTMDYVETAGGTDLPVAVQGDTVRVGNATILLGNIQAGDGVIHIMDRPVVGTSLGAEYNPPTPSPTLPSSMLAVARPPRAAATPPLSETGAPGTTPMVPLPAPSPEARVPPAAATAVPSVEQTLVVAPAAEATRPSTPLPAPSPELRQPPSPPAITIRVPSPVLPSPQPPPSPPAGPQPPASPLASPRPPAPSPAQASPSPKPSPAAASPPPSPAVLPSPRSQPPSSPSPPPTPTISLLLSSTDTSSTTGCACTSSGVSGTVQTGQTGCIRRAGESFVLPVQFCYVQDPACSAANPSSTFPGAAWRLCP